MKTEQGHSTTTISIDAYWREVASQIEVRFAMGHPSSWSKPTIDTFLEDFSEKLLQKCLADEQVALRCGVHTVKGELASQPGLSYFSFRRIFIKNESSGNQSTREMFAIYLGYASVTDLLQQSGLGIEPPPETVAAAATTTPLPEKKPWLNDRSKQRVILAAVSLAALIGLFTFLASVGTTAGAEPAVEVAASAPNKFLLVRNDDGIALSDLATGQTLQLISGLNYLTGIEYDAGRRQLFWANSDGNYSCLGTATLNAALNGIIPGSLNTRLTKRMGLPAGIALDTATQLIYCADYEQQKLVLFDYQGNEVAASITQHPVGKPSSIELDPRDRVLYWTDIKGQRINRLFLGLDSIEYGFISESGTYPDGLSLDLKHNTIWWASNTSKEIGYGRIDKTEFVKIQVPYPTTAVEIDPTTEKLYCSIWNSDLIRTMVLGDPSQQLPAKYHADFTLSAGGFSPGVIKLVDLSE